MTWDQIERKWEDMARRVQTQWDQRSQAADTVTDKAVPQAAAAQALYRTPRVAQSS